MAVTRSGGGLTRGYRRDATTTASEITAVDTAAREASIEHFAAKLRYENDASDVPFSRLGYRVRELIGGLVLSSTN